VGSGEGEMFVVCSGVGVGVVEEAEVEGIFVVVVDEGLVAVGSAVGVVDDCPG